MMPPCVGGVERGDAARGAGEPCPCPFGVWPMCLVRCPRLLVLIVVVRCVFQIDRIYRFRTDFTA